MMPNPYLHLTKEVVKDETMGFRAFSNLNIPDNPRDNWGMKLRQPQWIQDVHNTHVGERVFIFGTGPSLIDQLSLLKMIGKEHTVTCNRVKRWKEIPFTPWLHAVTEPGPFLAWGRAVGESFQFPEATNKIGCCWFPVDIPGWNWLPKAPDDIQVRWQGAFGMGDYLPPIPTAWASPLTIAQLLLWMGFSELYILGTDVSQMGQVWDREKGTTKYPRNIRSIIECADRLRSQVWLGGRKIWDLTPGGRMNVEGAMPYRELRDVLEEIGRL
jgi:hypothetical protein